MADKILIVTGGGRGIGAAICRLAAADGWDVAVNYVGNKAAAELVVADIAAAGRRAVAVRADVSKPQEVRRLFDTVTADLGAPTGLVNNAGVTGKIARLDEIEPEVIQEVVDINVMGAILPAREAVLRMSTKHGGAGGVIVNISSVAARLGPPSTYVWYAATKGAVDSLTRGLAQEVIGEGIRVTAVAPGITETEIHASGGMPDRVDQIGPNVPLGRAAQPEEIAEAVVWMLSDKSSYVVGETLYVGGGR